MIAIAQTLASNVRLISKREARLPAPGLPGTYRHQASLFEWRNKMELDSLLLFAIASLSINLLPGPDVVYIVSNTMKGNFRVGLQAALGLGVGYCFHTVAAVLGLSTLILNSALAFTAVKYLGAAYLLYLGLSSFRKLYTGNTFLQSSHTGEPGKNVFQQGVIVSVLNPKVALFFLSFLPQFVDIHAGETSLQLMLLGLTFSALATLCNLLYATIGSWLFNQPKMSRYSRVIEGISGTLLIGLASKIALSKN